MLSLADWVNVMTLEARFPARNDPLNSQFFLLYGCPHNRKNWLFCWPETGAEQVGVVQSLIVTCRLHDVDPYDYLVDVLQRGKIHEPLQMDELAPRRWKESFASNPMRTTLYLIDEMTKKPAQLAGDGA